MHHPILKKFTLLFSMVFPYQQLLKQSGRLGTKYSLNDYSKKDPHIYHGRLYPKSVQELLLAMGQTRK